MGKNQSKHGQCYLVNAHFNPLCQLEDSNSVQSIETRLTSQDSGLQLTPEISFTLSEEEEEKNASDKTVPTKCSLEVFLPKESVDAVLKESSVDLTLKNSPSSDHVPKKQQTVKLECVQNNNQSEKQEFSFVLRNYSRTGADKNDIEKIVLSSICETLKSSLKLPPSGTHTLKVHLTLSPEQEQDLNKQKRIEESAKTSPFGEKQDDSCQLLPSDVAITSTPERQPNVFAKCCQQDAVKNLIYSPARHLKHEASPSPRTRRQRIYGDRKEARRWADAAQSSRRDYAMMNLKSTLRHSENQDCQHLYHKERQPKDGDCTHYLDLARLKISDSKHASRKMDQCDPRYMNPAYCSPRHLSKSRKTWHASKHNNPDFSSPATPKKHSTELRHKLRESELHSGVLKYKLLQKAKNNCLDLSFDLCDLDEKQPDVPAEQTETAYHHRRSRSHDMNQYSFLNSPKVMNRTCSCTRCSNSLHYDDLISLSPNNRHRHCHRKREKEKLRAMEQVARWLEREEPNHANQTITGSHNSDPCGQENVIERHEYHHIHEHHHYYHYVES